MTLVLDAPVIAAALFPSQRIDGAEALLRSLTPRQPMPALALQELANTSLRLERRGLVARAEADRALGRLDAMALEYVESAACSAAPSRARASPRQPRIFDAIYLACAEDLDAELWTCDRRSIASFGDERPARLRFCPNDVQGFEP